MASLPTAADPSNSSAFGTPKPETLNEAKDPLPSTDPAAESSHPSNPQQASGNSLTSGSPSNDEETIIIIDENLATEESGEEEEECPFCLFMKGGGCKDSFIAWEKCVEEAEKTDEDVVNKCMEATSLLKKCMEEHANYYEPILRAEREIADAVTDDQTENEPVKATDT